MMRHLVLLGCACLIVQNARAPAFAARPFLTDDAGTVEAGKFELETACDSWKARADANMCFKHGLTERMDLGVGIGYVPLPNEERGFTGADLGLKFVLVPDLLAASFGAGFASQAYSINGILSKSFGPISCDVSLGYEAIAETTNADLTHGICAVYNCGKLGIGAEVGGTHEELNWWQVGARCQIHEWIQIDAGLGGNYGRRPDLTATTGVWITFPLSADSEKGD